MYVKDGSLKDPDTRNRLAIKLQFLQLPATIAMIDHLASHSPIYADILSGNKACLIGTEVQYHIGDIHRVTDSACGVLYSSQSELGSYDHAMRIYL